MVRASCSLVLALAHWKRKRDFGFRIRNGAHSGFDAFLASGENDRTLTLDALGDETALRSRILRVRLVRYRQADTESGLATSRLDDCRDSVPALSDLDPARWGGEERYPTGKFRIEAFPARFGRGVRPELYAAFVLLTLARPFANRCDHDLDDDRPALRTHFRDGLHLGGKEIEARFLAQSARVAQSVRRIPSGLSALHPARKARKQLRTAVETTQEQGAEPGNPPNTDTGHRTGPRLRVNARSARAYFCERQKTYPNVIAARRGSCLHRRRARAGLVPKTRRLTAASLPPPRTRGARSTPVRRVVVWS